MDENAPQNVANQQLFQLRPSRTFGAEVQLAASFDGLLATTKNWSRACQALQEKIGMLVFDMNQLRRQNIEYTRRDTAQGMRIWELKAEVEWLRTENKNLSERIHHQPSTSSEIPLPRKIRKIFVDLSEEN